MQITPARAYYPSIAVGVGLLIGAFFISLMYVRGNTAGMIVDYIVMAVVFMPLIVTSYWSAAIIFDGTHKPDHARTALARALPILAFVITTWLTPSTHWTPHEIVKTSDSAMHVQEIGAKNDRVTFLVHPIGLIRDVDEGLIKDRYYCSPYPRTKRESFGMPLCTEINDNHSGLINMEFRS